MMQKNDIVIRIETSLWNDRDGVLLGAHGEILNLRKSNQELTQALLEKNKKMTRLLDAIELFKSSINDYFEVTALHDVEIIRRRSARTNVTHSDTIGEVSSKLSDIVNMLGPGGSLESSVRMAADKMREASEMIELISQEILIHTLTNNH